MKRKFFSLLLLVFAAVIAVGSVTFLGPCVHEDGSEAVCTKAARAILADGILLAVLAALLLFVRHPQVRLVMFVLAAVAAVAGVLLPGTFLPICRMETMHCRMVMRPAMMILFAASALCAGCGIAAERISGRKS